MENNNLPRKTQTSLNVPAELAILNAMHEVERIGADVRLTNAVMFLQQAKDLVAQVVDEKLSKLKS